MVLGAALENAIPFAATHELIRQGRRDLNVIAPISDISTDMLIGAGCVAEVTGAWVGNVSGGMGHNFRRAAETGEPLDWFVLAICFAELGDPERARLWYERGRGWLEASSDPDWEVLRLATEAAGLLGLPEPERR